MSAYTGQMPGSAGIYEVAGPITEGLSETQILTIGGTPSGGTFKVALEGFTSSAITWSSTNSTLLANINTALDAMNCLGTGGCVATALSLTSGVGTVLLSFAANRQKQTIGSLMTVADNSLTGTSPTLAITQQYAGVTATLRGAAKGSVLVDSTGGATAYNTGTLLAPTWTRVPHPRYTLEEFRAIPVCVKNDGYSTPTGTAGDVNVFSTAGNHFEYNIKGTQTILAPAFSASGYDVSFDQTDNDGVEITQGITARSKAAFTIGTDAAFFATATFSIADVSGTDDCAFGFRKTASYTANIDDYTDFAALNVISGDINIETALNNAATTTTDTTDNWADGETHTLTVKVSSAGVVTYQIDGRAPTTVAAFTFDSGDVVVPFFYFLHSSDVAGAVNMTKWEVGLQ